MAYSRRSRSTRRGTVRRSSGSRSGYRGRAVRATSSRRTSSRRRSTGGARTIRIEVVSPAPNPVARPEIGLKAAEPARTKSAF